MPTTTLRRPSRRSPADPFHDLRRVRAETAQLGRAIETERSVCRNLLLLKLAEDGHETTDHDADLAEVLSPRAWKAHVREIEERTVRYQAATADLVRVASPGTGPLGRGVDAGFARFCAERGYRTMADMATARREYEAQSA
jgi:hypothetical protein